MPKPQGVTHEEMGEWAGSQGDAGKEGNQPVSQIFTLKQEALAFGDMTPGAFHLPSENTVPPGFGFFCLFVSFFSQSQTRLLFPLHLPGTL